MKAILAILIAGALALLSVTGVQAQTVTHVIGGNVACDPNIETCFSIPTAFTQLCISPTVCPPASQPSFTDPLRFWGGASTCRTTTNGGSTWVPCAGAPGVGTAFSIAGTADGNVVIAGTAVSSCVIKRSVDNGLTWTTQLTVANRNCNTQNGFGSLMRCLDDGTCVLPFFNNIDLLCYTYTTVDNGVNWSQGLPGVACSTFSGNQTTVAWDGTRGLMGNRGIIGGISRTYEAQSVLWNASNAWPAGNQSCGGTVVLALSTRALCQSALNVLSIRSAAGVLQQTFTLPGGSTTGAGAANGPIGASIGTNTLYVVYPVTAGNALGVWASRDGGATFGLLGTSGTGTSGMAGGDMYVAHGCIWFSVGNGTMFGKVC